MLHLNLYYDIFKKTLSFPGTSNGYLLLMKGVAGIKEFPKGVTDLFELWNSTKTSNEYQPGANSLTPSFPGHYKPSMSNNWPGLCLDKVRYTNIIKKIIIIILLHF